MIIQHNPSKKHKVRSIEADKSWTQWKVETWTAIKLEKKKKIVESSNSQRRQIKTTVKEKEKKQVERKQ